MSPGSTVPPDDGLRFWVAISGLGTTILAMFAGAISFGKKVEKLENELKTAVEKSESNEQAIEELKSMTAKIETHDDTIKKILALFTDSEGNQRVMTTYICDKKSAGCTALIYADIKHMAEMFGERMQGLEKLIKTGNEAALDAILKAIKEK